MTVDCSISYVYSEDLQSVNKELIIIIQLGPVCKFEYLQNFLLTTDLTESS